MLEAGDVEVDVVAGDGTESSDASPEMAEVQREKRVLMSFIGYDII